MQTPRPRKLDTPRAASAKLSSAYLQVLAKAQNNMAGALREAEKSWVNILGNDGF